MKKVIVISILDFNISDYPEYFSKTTVLDNHRDDEFMHNIQHIFIELPNFRKSNKLESKLDYWLTFTDYKNKGGH